jgi:KDO2-lipid IV(A) lauroyltransferase
MSAGYAHVSRRLYRREWFAAGLAAARWIPRGVLRPVAGASGRIYAWTHPSRARVAEANVRQVVPDAVVTGAEIYADFARMLADYFVAGARGDRAIVAMTGKRVGYTHLKGVFDAGRGAVLATLHLGFFELGGWVLGQMNMPTLALTRPEPDPGLTRWRADFRKRWGMDTLEVGQDPFALLEALEALKEGRLVAALVDRPHPQQRLEVHLSNGATVACSKAVLQLAAKAGAPVLPLVVYANARGIHEFEAMEPVEVDPADLPGAAMSVWERLLPVVRRVPAQYFQFEDLS